MIGSVKRVFRKIYNRIRFGNVTAVVKDTVSGAVCEVVYMDSRNRVVGYWAYGYFDPSLPYRE